MHTAIHVSSIEPIRTASNPIRDAPNLDAMDKDEPELGHDVKGYEYRTGYEV